MSNRVGRQLRPPAVDALLKTRAWSGRRERSGRPGLVSASYGSSCASGCRFGARPRCLSVPRTEEPGRAASEARLRRAPIARGAGPSAKLLGAPLPVTLTADAFTQEASSVERSVQSLAFMLSPCPPSRETFRRGDARRFEFDLFVASHVARRRFEFLHIFQC